MSPLTTANFPGAIVYVAAPYRADTAEGRARNVERAGLITRLLLHLGAYPICLHAAIDAGHYGDDDDPEQRERGMRAAEMIAFSFWHEQGGAIVALLRDDGTESEGVARETAGKPIDVYRVRWSDLGDDMRAVGLGEEWERLA